MKHFSLTIIVTILVLAGLVLSGVRKYSNSDDDIQILRRAKEILSDSSKWNRQDDRNCLEGAKQWSLYCALYKSSMEVTGKFDHRSLALEEVRATVEEVAKGKNYGHRLMHYNNDPTTSLDDIKNVLEKSIQHLENRK